MLKHRYLVSMVEAGTPQGLIFCPWLIAEHYVAEGGGPYTSEARNDFLPFGHSEISKSSGRR